MNSIQQYLPGRKPARLLTQACGLALLIFAALLSPGQARSSVTDQLDVIDRTSNPWFFQGLIAYSSDADFHDSVAGFDFERSQERNYLSGLSVGKKITDRFLLWPFEVVAYASIQQFNEREQQSNGWGMTGYLKAYHSFTLPFTSFPLRLGFGNGLSYVSRIPASETRDFKPYQSKKLIYYMDYSLQASVSHLMGRGERPISPTIDDIFFGYSIWHRSTFFGLLGDSTGGINYLGISVEFLFTD